MKEIWSIFMDMKRHFVTIKDIAKELEISVATVSRALRNTHDVNEATRQQVLAKAVELATIVDPTV
jgi:LacI family transcriptional regulator